MARKHYYYLVSGLPELLLDEGGKGLLPFSAAMSEVREEVTPEDFGIVSAMALPIDNRNLIAALEGKDEFDDRGNFSREELAEAVKSPEGLPAYMQAFLEAHKEGRQLFPGLTPLDQLTWLFYEEMAESDNQFIREWYEFDANLRNVAVGVNIRKGLGHIEALATDRDRPAAYTVVGRNDVAEAVLRSSAPDFGLAAAHPWVEKVIALGRGGLTEMEKGLDDIRWEMLGELTTFAYFQAETIAAFMVKLLIVERWMKLEPAAGKARLDKLVSELMESFVMPEGF